MNQNILKCNAITKKGLRCKHDAINGSEFCAIHSPKFCRYCGTANFEKICKVCGSADNIEPEFEQPKPIEHILIEMPINSTMIAEERCDGCNEWISVTKLKNGLCSNCLLSNQYCTNCHVKLPLNHSSTLCNKCNSNWDELIKQKEKLPNLISSKTTPMPKPVIKSETMPKMNELKFYLDSDRLKKCDGCGTMHIDLTFGLCPSCYTPPEIKPPYDKCKICGHSIVFNKSKEKGYCHRCYESQIKPKTIEINEITESVKQDTYNEFNGANCLNFVVYFILISCIIITIIGFSLIFFETPPQPNYDQYTYPIPRMLVVILGHLEGY